MNELYLVYVGCSTDLLISKDKILLNVYSDSTSAYDIFERTAHTVAKHLGGEIGEISLQEKYHTIVEEMFEALDRADSCDKHIAEFIMDKGFVKEFE